MARFLRKYRLFLLLLLTVVVGCGGGSGLKVTLAESVHDEGCQSGVEATRTTGLLVRESEIATLADWQQEKMADPGWSQPYLPPIEDVAMPAPTWEMLEEYLASERNRDLQIQPRSATGKGASWMDQGPFDGEESVMQGEYYGVARDATPAYGCNNDGSNGAGDNAFEDVLREGTKYQPQAVSYVENGLSAPNWFNRSGGSGNDAQSTVYQLFASTRNVDASNWEILPAVSLEELSYRADLAPGIGPGGDCSAAAAFLVAGLFWKRFNSVTTALPNMAERNVYDILIAPSSEQSEALISIGHTVGRYQEFYCGDLAACYGGGWIVGLESAASGCAEYDTNIEEAYDAGDPLYFRPIYGVLLKRWREMALPGMDGPWDSWLGWPVAGPVTYDGGRLHRSFKGTYYAWGMWFEMGFIWWLDYDQEQYPEIPDEAQGFYYTGGNVLCPESGSYERLGDTVYYGGGSSWDDPQGHPHVVVDINSYRVFPDAYWSPCDRSERDQILLPLEGDGLSVVNVAMQAHAWGGTPNPDGSYNYYVWAFRDGTILMGDESEARSVTHNYGSDFRNMESVYTVRVQVTDSTGAVAYGDSRPIIVGHTGAATYR